MKALFLVAVIATASYAKQSTQAPPECPKLDIQGRWQEGDSDEWRNPGSFNRPTFFDIAQKGCERVMVKKTTPDGNVELWQFDLTGQTTNSLPAQILKANEIGGKASVDALKTVRYRITGTEAGNYNRQKLSFSLAGNYGGNDFLPFRIFGRVQGSVVASGPSSWTSNNGTKNDPMNRIYIKMESARLADVVEQDVVNGEKNGFMQAANILISYIVRNSQYVVLKRVE